MTQVLIRGGLVLAMDVPGAVRADVVITDGIITEVGPDVVATADSEVIDADGSVVMPGFVDTHRHMWQGSVRGTAGDDVFGEYFGRAVMGYAGKADPDDMYVGNLLAALEAIESGTTTVLDWSHAVSTPEHADAAVQALEDSGIRAVYAYGPPGGDAPAWWTDSERTHPADARRLREEVLRDDTARVTMALALRGPEFSTMSVVDRDLAFARELGLRSTMHIGIPGLYHQRDSVRALSDRGLLGADITHVHATAFTPDDMRRVADVGGSLSISPEVELQMGFGWPPLRSALDAGLRPSVSVDVVSAVGGDLRLQARILAQVGRAADNAATLARGEAPGALQISTWDALEFATAQGARALGMQDRIGTLQVGKRADVVVVDGSGWNLTPLNDPASQVLQAAHPGNIKTVLIDGAVVKRNGVVVAISEGKQDELRARATAVARRLR